MLNHATRKLWRQGVNPVATIGFTDVRKAEAGVYSPEEISKILKATAEMREDFIPSLALMIFAGIRPEIETLKLTWEEIDLEEGFVDVCMDTAKKDRRRHIEIESVLREWLEWYIARNGKQTGRVCPWSSYRSINRNRDLILAAAKVEHHADVYRHSFASYHLCHIRDLWRLVKEMGHQGDPQVLNNHYIRMVKKKQAALFWQLTPGVVLAN